MSTQRILVVGGSLGGLLAANVLLRAGHDVTLLEKSHGSLDGRGAGIVTHRGLLEALRTAGAAVDDTLGVAVRARVALDAGGATVARIEYPQLLTSWSRLYTLLRDALPAERYRAGHEVIGVSQTGDAVQLSCRDGAVFEADLLVASDGIRSAVRGLLAPEAQPRYAGYVAWRGVCDESVLSPHTRETLFDHFGFGLPDGEQIIGYPVAGAGNTTRAGERRYNFVWYRPADEGGALRELMTDAGGVHHAGGIAPHKVSAHAIARMRAAARARLAPQWAEVIDKTAQPFLQPIHDLMSERIVFGRVALMGDAAFVARPHVGMGVTKAGDDALALARALAGAPDPTAAWPAYEAARLAPGRAVVERARRLGAYMEAAAAPQRAARDTLAVLNETAIDLAEAA
jgi:2-polyprenyl-6-methoxyphenol hydroxylase-like FAD-dependent oxidoreductase